MNHIFTKHDSPEKKTQIEQTPRIYHIKNDNSPVYPLTNIAMPEKIPVLADPASFLYWFSSLETLAFM